MKKFLVSLVVIAVIGGATAWFKRVDIILALAKYKSSQAYADIAPTREIPWQQGPASPAAAAGERPPNIILIVADDLGYNDISTFGGGVGGMQTPSIDRLAAEGAVFTQSYSGASTCAPSRAMMMIIRYALCDCNPSIRAIRALTTPALYVRVACSSISSVAG